MALLSATVSLSSNYLLGLLGLVYAAVSYSFFRKQMWSLIFGIFAIVIFLFAKWMFDILLLVDELLWLKIVVAGENIFFLILILFDRKNYFAVAEKGKGKNN